MPTHHRILSLIYPDFEPLDLFGPLGAIVPRSDYYTLKLANIPTPNQGTAPPNSVESSLKNGIGTTPNLSLAEALKEDEHFDTLFIPGGTGMLPLIQDAALLRQIGQLVDRAANVFTVCTGSLLLAATGRLDGREATTNKRVYDERTPNFPKVQWRKRARWVQDSKYLTSSGVTAGIDAAFAFLATTYVSPEDRIANPAPREASQKGDAMAIPGFDREKALRHARSVAWGLEYRWHEDPGDDPFVEASKSMNGNV